MVLYTVITNYGDGFFGSYSSISRARKAIEYFLGEAADIVSFEDTGDYSYQYTNDKGETYSLSILTDTLDWEFETGEIKEDE